MECSLCFHSFCWSCLLPVSKHRAVNHFACPNSVLQSRLLQKVLEITLFVWINLELWAPLLTWVLEYFFGSHLLSTWGRKTIFMTYFFPTCGPWVMNIQPNLPIFAIASYVVAVILYVLGIETWKAIRSKTHDHQFPHVEVYNTPMFHLEARSGTGFLLVVELLTACLLSFSLSLQWADVLPAWLRLLLPSQTGAFVLSVLVAVKNLSWLRLGLVWLWVGFQSAAWRALSEFTSTLMTYILCAPDSEYPVSIPSWKTIKHIAQQVYNKWALKHPSYFPVLELFWIC